VLGQAIGHVLPSAVGVALSPVPIIAVVLMLATPRARSNGPAFAIGWIVGLAAVSAVVLAVAGGASDPGSATADGVNWVTLGLGILFLAMAARQWRGRPRHGEAMAMPSWMRAVDHFTPVKSAGLGFVLSAVNPKNLALTLAAAASIAQADLGTTDDVVAIAVFVVLASLSVAGLVAWYLVAPRAAAKPLDGIRDFMARNNAVIMCLILLVLGAKLIGDGLGGVTT
jgi:threonine/homoserine/homoserine lactone efflux protein